MSLPLDSKAFGYAVGGLALALIVTLTGICLILAFGAGEVVRFKGDVTHSKPPSVPTELWATAGALAAALLGLLVPAREPRRCAGILVVVLVLAVLAAIVAGGDHAAAVAVVGAAGLLGVLAPSPGRSETE